MDNKEKFKKIRMEDVYKAIVENGFYTTPTEKHYDENFIGPELIVVTDDPDFKVKHPELSEMIIVSSVQFKPMADIYNESMWNDQREIRRYERWHNTEGYYEDASEDENGNCRSLKIKDMPMNPVQDEVEKRLDYEGLHKAIKLLNEVQRKRVMMYYFEGKSQQEIADIQGVRLYTVQKSIKAAEKFLKKILKTGGESASPSPYRVEGCG